MSLSTKLEGDGISHVERMPIVPPIRSSTIARVIRATFMVIVQKKIEI